MAESRFQTEEGEEEQAYRHGLLAAAEKEDDEDCLTRPFEWLTSPASLLPILQPLLSEKENVRVLHVGSGSSVLGEYILETFGSQGSVALVVNVDKDETTLRKMKSRWQKLQKQKLQQQHQQQDDECNHSSSSSWSLMDKLVFETVDLVQQRIPHDSGSFDLVLDKSTLDCTLCSDHGTAWLLHEVYRLLNADGGTYVLVSFHDLELLVPLLENCPGTCWSVQQFAIPRQVEDLITIGRCAINNGGISSPQEDFTVKHSTAPFVNTDKFDHEHYRRMVNVLVAKRYRNNDDYDDNDAWSSTMVLDVNAIYQHIHQTNNHWYKTRHPILDKERLATIRQAFGEQRGSKMPLTTCYHILFTDAEREHLTYDYFLEDWIAFVHQRRQLQQRVDDDTATATMTLEIALAFLEEMQ